MKAIPYTTKSGLTQFKPECTQRKMELIMIGDSYPGWCLACGKEVKGVEPDARKYTCAKCDKPKVYGMAELMMMGLVEIK